MIRLAICDDDPLAVEQIEAIIAAFRRESHHEQIIETSSYLSPLTLCDDAAEGKVFDVLLLDVEMPEMTGIALADKLRGHLPAAPVIFLTSHTELHYAQQSFKVGAIRYVSKLNMEQDLPEALEAAIRACAVSAPVYYTLTHYSDVIRLPVDEIVSVRRVSRNLEVTTVKQGTLTESRGLKEMLDALDDERFLLIDRSCFVNLDHVVQLSDYDVIMDDGAKLPVSRRLMPQIKAAIMRIWGKSK